MGLVEDEEFIRQRRQALEQKARDELVAAAKRYEEFGYEVKIQVYEKTGN